MSDNINDVEVEETTAVSGEENAVTDTTPEQDVELNAAEENVAAEEQSEKSDGDDKPKAIDYNNDVDDDDDDDEEEHAKNGKKKKKPLTRAQKKKRRITALISVCAVILALGIFISGVAIANPIVVKALIAQAKNYTAVEYGDGEQFIKGEKGTVGVNLYQDDDEYWTFVTDNDFKVLQLTDVHIGGGSFSKEKDMWAMNAVATMIRAEKPDLVIVTGDIAFPVPYASGSFNNLGATKIFANMMESLGVYWTFAFGNHDTEAYSMYTRDDICNYYEEEIQKGNLAHCLFQRGEADDPALKLKEDDLGYGNTIIKVKNTQGIVTQALVTLDSHSYIEGDYFGAAWKYDNIHQSQVDWYVAEMQKLVQANKQIDPNCSDEVKNLAFFHIPLVEYREAWSQVINSNRKDLSKGDVIERNGTTVKYYYGKMGESDKKKNGQRTYGVFCGLHQDDFFEQGVQNGLQGTFSGHDHYNNFSVEYTKSWEENGETKSGTVRLTYGMSIDYLAYPGIYKEHLQRGCTVITVEPDGDFDCVQKNYYEDYNVKHEKG
ncbi:MAG: metallophosphoesterase [Bacteroides sp.]|nr:metallophosphoesterase [Bacillota bacterium]MCM1393410.1 metallophosphoesterase [[Eubacterium] siraeum]MCM1455396.1 metallophosphoesterase [Bacteroides sp.]